MKIDLCTEMNVNPSEVTVDDGVDNQHHHHRGHHQAAVCRCKYNQRAYDYLLVKAIQLKQNDFNINIKLGLLKAAKSVLKYPLPILSEEEALLLNGVGKTISKEIMKALSFGSCPTVTMNRDDGDGGGSDGGNITRTMSNVNNSSCDDNQHSCINFVIDVEKNHTSRRQQDASIPLSVVPTTHTSTTHALTTHASMVEDSLHRNSSTSQLSMNHSTRKYIPEFGKVPWTILIALYRLGGNANKAQIEMEVFELNRTYDFIHANNYRDTRYPSLSILKKKGLIEEEVLSSPPPSGHLWLTETGTRITIELYAIFLRRGGTIVSTVTTIATSTAPPATGTTASTTTTVTTATAHTIDSHNEDPSRRGTSSSDIIIWDKDHDVDYNSNRIINARSDSIRNNNNSIHGYGSCNNDVDEDRYEKHAFATTVCGNVGKDVQQSYPSVAIRRPTYEVVDLCSPMISNASANTDNDDATTDQHHHQYRSQQSLPYKHSRDPSCSPHTPLSVRPCRITTPSFVSMPLITIEDDRYDEHDEGVMGDRYDGGDMDDRYDGSAMDDQYDGGAMDDRYDGVAMDDRYDGSDDRSYDNEAMICCPPLQEDVTGAVESYQIRLMSGCREDDDHHHLVECSDDAPRTATAAAGELSIAMDNDSNSRSIDYRARIDVMKEERNSGVVVDLTLDDSSADEARDDGDGGGDDDDGDDDGMRELYSGRDQSSSRLSCSSGSNAATAAVSFSPSSSSTTTTTTTTAVRSLFSHVISARLLHEEYVHTVTHTNCMDIDIINQHDDREIVIDKDIVTDRGDAPMITTSSHSSGSLFSMLASKHKQFLDARVGQTDLLPPASVAASSSSSSSSVGIERSATSASSNKDAQKENVHSNIVLDTSKAKKRSTAATVRSNKSHKEAAATASTVIMSSATTVAAENVYIGGDQQARSGEGLVSRSYYQQKTLSPLSSLHACDWEVVLLIDKRERSNALIQGKMVANGVPSELCNLAVGDFLWVVRPVLASSSSSSLSRKDPTTATTATASQSSATSSITSSTTANSSVDIVVPPPRGQDGCEEDEEEGSLLSAPDRSNHNTNSINNNNHNTHNNNAKSSNAKSSYGLDNSNSYYVLDCVAERKTIADLASSISDGRYIEQKSRLKACNLRSTMYIIEGEHIVVPTQQRAITAASIKTAIVSINVDNDMNVLRTRGIDHTITCLLTMHRQVLKRFIKILPSNPLYQPFQQFQQMYMKQGASTNKQLFGFQLRQIHGCSTAVAMTLMEKYGTTANFMQELHKMGPLRAEFTLTNLKRYGTGKKIGPMLSKKICRVYLDKY